MSKHWQPCPRCESNKVKTLGKLFWFLLMVGTGGMLIWFSILFMPFLFISLGLIFLSPIAFIMPKVNQCEDCKHSWLVGKVKQIEQ